VAITITDPREIDLPNVGLVELQDAENPNATFLVDTSNEKVREKYSARSRAMIEARSKVFSSVSMDHIDIRTDKPYIEEFIKFFKKRKKRI
jgi:hypothetical protein